jgi:hypothetical protein
MAVFVPLELGWLIVQDCVMPVVLMHDAVLGGGGGGLGLPAAFSV